MSGGPEASRDSGASRFAREHGVDLLAVAILWVYFAGLPIAAAKFHYGPGVLALLALSYGLLATALHAGACFARSFSWPLAALGSLGVGAAVAWQWREIFNVPERVSEFAMLAGAAGLAYGAVLVARRPPPRWLAGGAAMGAVLALMTVIGVGYGASHDFRWHLLRHNRILGTAAYYALARPVPEVRNELWDERIAQAAGHRTQPPAIASSTVEVEGKRPNIVFILIDTLRADSLAVYGGNPLTMPRLNRFAESSLVLADVQAAASWTRPSVASMFTGLRPEEHGAIDRHTRLSEWNHTLAEKLRSEGYSTVAFVSNFANVGVQSGFAQGFDRFVELKSGRFPYARAEEVNAEVLTWLEQRPRPDDPLFLYVHYLDPHAPYLSGGGYTPNNRAQARQNYEAELVYTDAHVGALLDRLRRQLGPETVVLLASDHGEEFDDHGEGGHGHTLYRELVHIPVLLNAPSLAPGRLEGRLEGCDIFHLILRLARHEKVAMEAWAGVREEQRGAKRYSSVYKTTPSSIHRPYQTHVCLRSIEDGDDLLIWSGYGEVWELYDLASDPRQRRNIFSERTELGKRLAVEMDEILGPWSVPELVEATDETLELLRGLGYVE